MLHDYKEKVQLVSRSSPGGGVVVLADTVRGDATEEVRVTGCSVRTIVLAEGPGAEIERDLIAALAQLHVSYRQQGN